MSNISCEQRIDVELKKIQDNLELYLNDEDVYENGSPEHRLPPFYNYGLSFDYVEPDTFDEQECGYYRYQLSWGGPSDEIRFFPHGKIQYWYMDWFDGAYRDITRESWARQLREFFEERHDIDWSSVQLY
jgi:hypothetical protein